MWTYEGDLNSASGENWKEPSSSTISAEASFKGDSNEETLNVNRTCWLGNDRKLMWYKIYPNITCPNRRYYGKYWERYSLLRNLPNVNWVK